MTDEFQSPRSRDEETATDRVSDHRNRSSDRVETVETDEIDVIFSYFFGQRAEFQHRAIFADFVLCTEAWIHGMAAAAQQDRARPGHLDISTSRHPERFDMKSI